MDTGFRQAKPVLFLIIFLLLPLAACSDTQPPVRYSYLLVNTFPHDPDAFTQGLVWDQGIMYEGTGKNGRSSLRRVNIESGNIEQITTYPWKIFAEGITVFQDTIYQLTWKNNRVYCYDKLDFSLLKTWHYPRQGWGLTHDNQQLIASDGSASLYFLDPDTLDVKKRITVYDHTGSIVRLNELEYIKGLVYANVWQTNDIVMIDPVDGRVVGRIDLASLRGHLPGTGKTNVLNGIMYDQHNDRLFVTGKLWPLLFEIRIVPAS